MIRSLSILAAGGLLMGAGAARAAEDAPSGGWTLSGEIGVVSDYRYRGYSLSDGDPSVQGGLTATASNGVYASVWGAGIAEYGVGPDGDGARVEVDLVVGKTFSLGGWDWDAAVMYYGYPDGSNVDYVEIPLSASRASGAFTTTLGLAWAPAQDNLGGDDNLYLSLAGDYAPERWPVSISGHIGREDGAFADGKIDWALGLAKDFGPVSLTLEYTDSDGPGAESAVIGGLSFGF